MDYVASFVKGAREIDLAGGGNWRLGRDFTPPAIDESYNIADGTAGNVSGGGRRTGRKANVRALSIPLHLEGASSTEIERELDELNLFLGEAGDEREPLFFKFRPKNSMAGETLLGVADASKQIKVLGGVAEKGPTYWQAQTREHKLPNCQARLVIDATIESAVDQYLGSATGGVLEDWEGTANGFSRGVIVAEATTNKFTNPIFGHATYDNGWSVTNAALLKAKNTEKAFRLYGPASMLLTNTDTTTAYALVKSLTLTVANYVVTFRAKKRNKSAVTDLNCNVWYGVVQTSTYTPLGNGWYRVTASFTGSAAATDTGVRVRAGRQVYVDGFHCEQKNYATPLCHGDQFGCTWSGTAHDSESSRTAGRLRYGPWALQASNFTWWIALKADRASSALSADVRLMEEAASGARLSIIASTGQVIFNDGTNAAAGAATAFAAGDILILHATMDSAGLALYRNGAADGAGNASYAPLNGATLLYIGSTDTTTLHGNFTILGAGTRDHAMSATEVAAHYADVYQRAAGGDGLGQRVDHLPFVWTEDGDEVLDNADDTSHENTAVVGGIPGNMPARTMFKLGVSSSKAAWLCQHSDRLDDFQRMSRRWYMEGSGTADANASGGEYKSVSAPTSTPRQAISVAVTNPDEIAGDFHFFARAKRSADANAALGFYIIYNGGYLYTDDKDISLTTAYRWWYLGKVSFDPPARMLEAGELDLELAINVEDTNGSGTFHLDCGMVINGKIALIELGGVAPPGGSGASTLSNYRKVQGKQALMDSGTFVAHVRGSAIELEPERYNLITTVLADNGGLHVLSDTITLSEVRITPRWALL